MQLCTLVIGSALTIAITSTQSAAWSFMPNSLNHANSTEDYQLAIQPVTSGEAAERSLDTTPKDSSDTQTPPVLQQPTVTTESGTQNSNAGKHSSTDCQFIPQTAGGLILKQLDALSKCNFD